MRAQRWPPAWLCVGLPIVLLLSAAAVYQQEALTEAIVSKGPEFTTTIVNKIYGTLDSHSPHHHEGYEDVEPTIIREGNHDEYLAVCLFAKNQALDMVEWFQHHYYEMGIRRFYVMDDASDPPLSAFMDDYGIPEEAIDFIHYNTTTATPQGSQLYVSEPGSG